jgi:hypothetical protein
MSHKSNWFSETGFLSEEGHRGLLHFRAGLQDILQHDTQEMTVAELQLLKANLQKMVGDEMSHLLTNKQKRIDALGKMTDQQFLDELNDRHGEGFWQITKGSLSPEEETRLAAISKARINELLTQGADRIKGKYPRTGGMILDDRKYKP